MASVPQSGRALWTLVVVVVAVIGAAFAATLGGAGLFILVVAVAGYLLYAFGYRVDRWLRKSEWF